MANNISSPRRVFSAVHPVPSIVLDKSTNALVGSKIISVVYAIVATKLASEGGKSYAQLNNIVYTAHIRVRRVVHASAGMRGCSRRLPELHADRYRSQSEPQLLQVADPRTKKTV